MLTPIEAAASFCRRPRSCLRLRRWSPRVAGTSGYGIGFLAVSVLGPSDERQRTPGSRPAAGAGIRAGFPPSGDRSASTAASLSPLGSRTPRSQSPTVPRSTPRRLTKQQVGNQAACNIRLGEVVSPWYFSQPTDSNRGTQCQKNHPSDFYCLKLKSRKRLPRQG